VRITLPCDVGDELLKNEDNLVAKIKRRVIDLNSWEKPNKNLGATGERKSDDRG
jgi:hypothetical protein